jgi:hypothetical protein
MREDAEQVWKSEPEPRNSMQPEKSPAWDLAGEKNDSLCPGCFDPKEKQKHARWWKSDAERSESRSHGLQDFQSFRTA